jgi:hypothetical protein
MSTPVTRAAGKPAAAKCAANARVSFPDPQPTSRRWKGGGDDDDDEGEEGEARRAWNRPRWVAREGSR